MVLICDAGIDIVIAIENIRLAWRRLVKLASHRQNHIFNRLVGPRAARINVLKFTDIIMSSSGVCPVWHVVV